MEPELLNTTARNWWPATKITFKDSSPSMEISITAKKSFHLSLVKHWMLKVTSNVIQNFCYKVSSLPAHATRERIVESSALHMKTISLRFAKLQMISLTTFDMIFDTIFMNEGAKINEFHFYFDQKPFVRCTEKLWKLPESTKKRSNSWKSFWLKKIQFNKILAISIKRKSNEKVAQMERNEIKLDNDAKRMTMMIWVYDLFKVAQLVTLIMFRSSQ